MSGLEVASFPGANQDTIQAIATDASGNIYAAGTTYSALFPVKNAAQPVFGESAILRTTDLGATWSRVGSPAGSAVAVIADPADPQVIFTSGANGIFRSTDSGETWQSVYAAAVTSAATDPGNHLHLAALTATETLIRSLDGGTTWAAGGAACGIAGCGQLLADPTGSGTLLVTGLGISISRDWGLTFQSFGPPGGVGTPNAAAFDPSHPGWIYVDRSAGVAGGLFLTTDFGASWTQKASPPSTFSSILNLAVDPDQPGVLVAATANGLYKSSDGAASWALQTPSAPPAAYFLPETNHAFVLAPHRCSASGGIFALGSGVPGSFAVSFSPDFGVTWKTPQLTNVLSVARGAGCTFYVTRTPTSDAFVAKIAPNGETLWSTFLGGSDHDAPVAVATDTQGNVYVAGNTSSPDFPTSVAHIGPPGNNSVFLAKFTPGGLLTYSAMLGGEAANNAIALAVDANQNVYVAGKTDSLQFPITTGTVGPTLDPGSYTGFLVKVSSNGALGYATYLGPSYTFPGAILVNANQEVTVAGSGIVPGSGASSNGAEPQFVLKLDPAASRIVTFTYLAATQAGNGGSVTGMATDAQNNLIVFGHTPSGTVPATPGAYSSPPQVTHCNSNVLLALDDAYLTKLGAVDWQPIYTATFSAACGIETGAVAIDSTGATVMAMGATNGLSLRGPIAGGGACASFSSAIAKLSADSSTLQYATYLPNCGVPGMALAPDGSAYVGVSPLTGESATSILRLKIANSAPISLDGVANAFSGDASAVTSGGLYSLAISGFQPAAVNFGLNPSQNLPDLAAGVQVLFDGVPASILATAPGRVMVAAPAVLPDPSGKRAGDRGADLFTSTQVSYNGLLSNAVLMPVSRVLPGLLTTDFPSVLPHADYADAAALNPDGTQNDANHPAAAGSTITVFTTGMGVAAPPIVPGSVASSSAVSPITAIYSSWETSGPSFSAPPLTVSSIAGFVAAMFQIHVPMPANITTLQGTDVGNEVRRVALWLQLGVPVVSHPPPLSNIVAVYVN